MRYGLRLAGLPSFDSPYRRSAHPDAEGSPTQWGLPVPKDTPTDNGPSSGHMLRRHENALFQPLSPEMLFRAPKPR